MDLGIVTLALYVAAATGGFILASRLLFDQPNTLIMSGLHFLFAAAATVCLTAFVATGVEHANLLFAIIMLGGALAGGLVMAGFGYMKKYPPKWLVLGHAGSAMIGLVTLFTIIEI